MRKHSKPIFGVGIDDLEYVKSKYEVVNGKNKATWKCPYYQRWVTMLSRCYCQSTIDRNPSYAAVTVCEEWLVFSNFKSWMETQDWKGKDLDKDLLHKNVPKKYSPETCAFVSKRLNYLVLSKKPNKKSSLPVGVKIERSGKRKKIYGANCRNLEGFSVHLGVFTTALEAHIAFLKAKIQLITQIMKEDHLSEQEKRAIASYQTKLRYYSENGIEFKP